MVRVNKRTLTTIIVIALIAGSVYYVGRLPVHLTDKIHSDVEGDVANPDVDIILIRSYGELNHIVLEMTVAGMIQNMEYYRYVLTVVAREYNSIEAHIYQCDYENGVVEQYHFETEVNNSTLKIFFSLSGFLQGSFMIGFEAAAFSPSSAGAEKDTTTSDRESPIARLWFL
jgi:hypothetical protein